MICKECGAYNPDHATFCKVCAASLKPDAAPKAPEEDQQPTKRFSRPSWIVPEQSEPEEKIVEEPVKEQVAETVEEQASPVVKEEPVQNDLPEQEEETPAPIWTPRSRRMPETMNLEEDDEEEAEAPAESEEEPDSIYNEEEALEEEEDPFEYEPTPPKRKQQKKKKNTMFTVLLIAIIVVIVGILVLGGYMLLKNQLNCGSSSQRNNPDAQQTGTQTEDQTTPSEPAETEAPALDSRTAQLQELIDENNKDLIAITVVVPANSTVVIDFPNQDDYTYENTEAKDITRKVKIPVEVFYPNKPLEEPTVVFQPDITINQADGTSYKVNCPTFTRTFPKLNITITAPIPEGEEPFMAPESNIVSLQGTIDDPAADVFVNGVQTVVYTGGVFMYDYKFADGVSEDTVDTITVSATKINCVGDTKEIKVHAYKFIPEPMTLVVKSEGNALRTDKSGKLTVTGTTLPGATLTATSDNATNVLCGSVNVDGEGNFSLQITAVDTFYGTSVITLNAEKEGAESASTQFKVLRAWSDYKTFRKFYIKNKTYLEVPKIDDLLANIDLYATNTYGFRISAKVVEVITVDGDTIVKMTNNKTNETLYVHKLSTEWKPEENIGSLYNIWCNFTGTYSDTGCCEFDGWFARKVK